MNVINDDLRVLVAEDDAATAALVAEVLEEHGYLVTRAATVQEAAAYLELFHFDLALLDLVLPDGTAEELARTPPPGAGAVLVMTGVVDVDLDGVPVLRKPFELHDLLDGVARAACQGRRKWLAAGRIADAERQAHLAARIQRIDARLERPVGRREQRRKLQRLDELRRQFERLGTEEEDEAQT